MKELKNFVAGQWLESDRTFEKLSPFNGQPIAKVYEGSAEMVDMAVRRGREAVFGAWGKTPIAQRIAVLRDLSQRLLARVDDLVEAEVADTGRSYWQARNFDGARAVRLFDVYCDLAVGMESPSAQFTAGPGVSGMWYENRRPKGVIGCITPWNVPLLMMTMKTAPALVMGNAVVAKPSEETPSSAAILAEVIAESDLPDGVFSLLHGFGANSVGAALTAHPDVDAFSFTGETGTGSAIMKAAADGLRDVALELGGKNAALVFDDAHMDRTIEGVTRSVFFNCGQICFCTERAYVHRSRFEEFVDRITNVAKGIVIGDRDHNGFNIGPLVSKGHQQKVKALLDTVPEDGGEFTVGGGIPRFGDERDDGAFIEPSVAIGLPENARFVKQEAFGPVLHVASFDDESEAIALANDTKYGLATSIWTENINRAHRVAPQVRVGHAWINSWQMRDLVSPLQGAGQSGIGQQFGRAALEFCSQPQTVTMRLFEEA